MIEEIVFAVGVGVEVEKLIVVAIGIAIGHAIGGHAVDESIGMRHESAGFRLGVTIEIFAGEADVFFAEVGPVLIERTFVLRAFAEEVLAVGPVEATSPPAEENVGAHGGNFTAEHG